MSKKIIFILGSLFISNLAGAQSLLNAAQALEGAQAPTAPAPTLTEQLENTAEQKLLEAAPAPVQNGVQTYQRAQQLKALGSTAGAGSLPSAGSSLAPKASGSVVDTLENNVTQEAVDLLK